MVPGFSKQHSGKGSGYPGKCALLALAVISLFSGCRAASEHRTRDLELEICFKTNGAYWLQFALYEDRPLPDFETAGSVELLFFSLGRTGLDLGEPLFSHTPGFSGLAPLPETGTIRLPVRYGDFVLILLGKELREPVWSYPHTEPGLLLKVESGPGDSPKLTFANDRRFVYEQSIDPDFFDSLEVATRTATAEETDMVRHSRTWMDLGRSESQPTFGLETRPGCPNDNEVLWKFED